MKGQLLRALGRPTDVPSSYRSTLKCLNIPDTVHPLSPTLESSGQFRLVPAEYENVKILLVLLHSAGAWSSAPRIRKVRDCAVWMFCRGRFSRGHLRTLPSMLAFYQSLYHHLTAGVSSERRGLPRNRRTPVEILREASHQSSSESATQS
jgi:hypothetical protein